MVVEMSVGKRGSLYWNVGDVEIVCLHTEGNVTVENGKRVRHMGAERWYHFARKRTWPIACQRGDCKQCMSGSVPMRRYILPGVEYKKDGEWVKAPDMWIPPTLDKTMAYVIEDAIAAGGNPSDVPMRIERIGSPRQGKWDIRILWSGE